MNTTEQHQAIEECIEKYITLAWKKYGRKFKRIPFGFGVSGTKAGVAKMRENEWKIDLNYGLFLRNTESFFIDTIPHEVAHVIAWEQFKGKGHGKEWKQVMTDFGLVPTRCHNYDVTNVVKPSSVIRYHYRCACPQKVHYLELKNHVYGDKRKCKHCMQPIVFLNKYSEFTA